MKKTFNAPFMKWNKIYILVGLLVFVVIISGFFFINNKRIERFATEDTAPVLQYFFMQSCGHCKDFNATWEKLKTEAKKEGINVKFDKIDISKVVKKEILSVPTIMLVIGSKSLEYDGKRDVPSIISFLNKNITSAKPTVIPTPFKSTMPTYDNSCEVLSKKHDDLQEQYREKKTELASLKSEMESSGYTDLEKLYSQKNAELTTLNKLLSSASKKRTELKCDAV